MARRAAALLAAALFIAAFAADTPAQQKAAPPAVPPQYPTLTTPATLAARLGGSTELTLTGTNLADATAVLVPDPAIRATIPEGQKDAAKLKVRFDVPGDTVIGLYAIRVATKYGVSNLRPLVVDHLPEVAEAAGNTKRETAQPVPVPCVVVGTAAAEASDFFKLSVKPGQRLTFEALGRRIGSPIDPVIILSDAKTGRELPGLYADDTPGLQSDARLTHTFADAGEVIVEIRDTTYRGGADFGYRLRIGDFPGATSAFPLAVTRGVNTAVGFAGPGLEGVPEHAVTAAARTAIYLEPFSPGRRPLLGWPVPVRVSDWPETVEKEPNNEPKSATRIPVPGGVSAKFGAKGDLDHFALPGKKGQKLEVVAEAYELNAPTEVYLRVLDAAGKELAKSNPSQPTARVEFTPPADGEYVVAAEHLNYLFGPNEVYHLTVRPAAPDFEVALGLDRADASAGVPGRLPAVGLAKRNGFNAPVELTVVSDGLAGSLTLPAGANPQPATPLYLPVTTKPGAKPGAYRLAVKATAKIDGKDVTRWAAVTDVVKASLANIPNPPPELLTDLAGVVIDQPLFELTVSFDKAEVAKGGTLKGKVTAKRADGFADEIALAAIGLPANVAAKLKPIAKGATESEIELAPAANAAAGGVSVTVQGTAKHQGRSFAYGSTLAGVKVVEAKKKEKK